MSLRQLEQNSCDFDQQPMARQMKNSVNMGKSKPKVNFSMSLAKGKASSKTRPKSTNGEKNQIRAVDETDEAVDSPKKDFVRGIGGGRVMTIEPEVNHGPRVIPLARNPWEGSRLEANLTTPREQNPPRAPHRPRGKDNCAAPVESRRPKEKSLDELAAEAIARESREGVEAVKRGDRDSIVPGLNSDRVISISTRSGVAEEGLEGGNASLTGRGGNAPLLAQNMIPGLAELDGEDEKFRHDLGYRAEDLSVRSQAYVDVPVSEFGAALLRGMGWEGPTGDADGGAGVKTVEPRHNRLGLGAQPKPPEDLHKQRIRKPGQKPRALEEDAKKLWERKAREEVAKSSASQNASSKLSIMDVVEISGAATAGERSSRSLKKQRAMILKTQGVPGLNKISVRLEDSGEDITVDRSIIVKVSEDDLARRPFVAKKSVSNGRRNDDRDGRTGRARSAGRSKRSRSRSRSVSATRNNEGHRGRTDTDKACIGSCRDSENGDNDHGSRRKKSKRVKKEKSKKRNHRQGERGDDDRRTGGYSSASDDNGSRDGTATGNMTISRKRSMRSVADSPMQGHTSRDRGEADEHERRVAQRHDSRNGTTSYRKKDEAKVDSFWLRPDIRVRVVHKSYAGGRAHLGKGRVIDVPKPGEATVRMDSGGLILEGVKQQHLETAVPARGGKVVVVRGPDKGARGKLLAKNKEDETALIQVFEDLRTSKLSLDDIAEYTAALDDDIEDLGY